MNLANLWLWRNVWGAASWGEYSCCVSQLFTPSYTRSIFQGLWHRTLQGPHSRWVYISHHWLWNKARHGSMGVGGGESASSRLRVHMAWLHWYLPTLFGLCPLRWEGCAKGSLLLHPGFQNKDTALNAAHNLRASSSWPVDQWAEAIYVSCYKAAAILEMFVIDNNHSRSSWLFQMLSLGEIPVMQHVLKYVLTSPLSSG